MNIEITRVGSQNDIEGILKLQQKNLRKNLTDEQIAIQGFVTVEHNLELLTAMTNLAPSIIAKDGDTVVGYALVMLPESRADIPTLEGLFVTIDKLEYKGLPLSSYKMVIIGQLCVADGYRGIGLVDKMYEHYKLSLKDEYQMAVTDISSKNPRSLKAHQRVGYQVLERFFDEVSNEEWDIVVWDWS
jgi:hypothetical protein